MTTVSGSLTSAGASQIIGFPPGKRFTVTITGTFSATVMIQRREGTSAWRLIRATNRAVTIDDIVEPGHYRVVVEQFSSGTVSYDMTVADVVAAGGGGASDLAGLSDVALSAPQVGDVLKWTGANWANAEDEAGGGATNVARRYLVRGGLNGIVSGTVDDIVGAANLSAIQALVDLCVAENAILEVEGEEFQIAGGPIVIPGGGFGFQWRGQLSTTIRQRTNNVPILQIGDTGAGGTLLIGADIDGMTLHYLNDQAGNTNANMVLFGNMWKCSFKNFRACNTIATARPYRCFYFIQGTTMFSCYFENMYAFQAHFRGLHIANFGTGNIWNNTYVSTVGTSGQAQSCSCPFAFEMGGGQQIHESVFNQFNVEWSITNQLMRINNVRGVVFNSLHLEHCHLSGAGPAMIWNSISNIQINGGAILDMHINDADVTDAFPSVVRSFNAGRTLWNNFIWVNNVSSYVDMPYFLHYQADNEGFITQLAKAIFVSAQVLDTSGTPLRDNMRVDRRLGGTDKEGGVWGNLHLNGASFIRSGGAMSQVVEGEHRVDVTKTIYGATYIEGTLVIPGTLAGNITVTLSNRMAPPNSIWANLPVPEGSYIRVCRGGTTVNTVTFNNHDGNAISGGSIGAGVASSEMFLRFSGGNWVVS